MARSDAHCRWWVRHRPPVPATGGGFDHSDTGNGRRLPRSRCRAAHRVPVAAPLTASPLPRRLPRSRCRAAHRAYPLPRRLPRPLGRYSSSAWRNSSAASAMVRSPGCSPSAAPGGLLGLIFTNLGISARSRRPSADDLPSA